jgi:hypothetical protein
LQRIHECSGDSLVFAGLMVAAGAWVFVAALATGLVGAAMGVPAKAAPGARFRFSRVVEMIDLMVKENSGDVRVGTWANPMQLQGEAVMAQHTFRADFDKKIAR